MKLSLLKRTRQPLLSANSPRLHLPGIIPPLRSPRSVGGEPPVGHAVSDDVEGQHSRDLGWATNLLGMQFAVCNKQFPAGNWSVDSRTSHSTKSSSSSGRWMLLTPSHLQIEFGGPPSIMRAASAISEISIFYESGLGYFRNMFHYESGLRSFRNNHPP